MVRWEVWGGEREGEGENAAVGVVGVQEEGERWDGEINRVGKGGGWITVIVMEWNGRGTEKYIASSTKPGKQCLPR